MQSINVQKGDTIKVILYTSYSDLLSKCGNKFPCSSSNLLQLYDGSGAEIDDGETLDFLVKNNNLKLVFLERQVSSLALNKSSEEVVGNESISLKQWPGLKFEIPTDAIVEARLTCGILDAKSIVADGQFMNHWVGIIFHKVLEYVDQQNPYINGIQLNELVMVIQEKYPEFKAVQYSKCFHQRIIDRFKNYRRKMNCASVIEKRKKYAKATVSKAMKRAVSDSDINEPLRLITNINEVSDIVNEAYLVTISNNVQTSLEQEVVMETTFMQRNNARETVGFLKELELFKSYFLSAENVYHESKRMLQVYQLNESSPYKDNGLDFEEVQVLMKDSLRNICMKWAPFLKRYSSVLNLVKMVNPTMSSSDSHTIGFQFIVARCYQKLVEFTDKNMIRLHYENGDFAVTVDKFSIPCANLIEVLLVGTSLSVAFNLIHCKKQEP